jgi:hypothetical protein
MCQITQSSQQNCSLFFFPGQRRAEPCATTPVKTQAESNLIQMLDLSSPAAQLIETNSWTIHICQWDQIPYKKGWRKGYLLLREQRNLMAIQSPEKSKIIDLTLQRPSTESSDHSPRRITKIKKTEFWKEYHSSEAQPSELKLLSPLMEHWDPQRNPDADCNAQTPIKAQLLNPSIGWTLPF